jgi:hypothetical protein
MSYCFADAMIHVSDEPSLSPSQSLQMSFGRASACSLKASLQMLVSSFDFTKLFAIEKSIVRSDCGIINTPVNTNDFFNDFFLRNSCFDDDVEEYSFLFGSDSCRTGIFEVVFLEVWRDFDSVFLSSIDCAYANHFGIWENSESVVVKPYRRLLFLGWLLFEFEPFEHITGLVSDSSNEAAVEFWVRFPDNVIGELVQSGFVKGLGFHPNINAFLTSLIAQANCSFQVIISNDFGSYCDLHNNPLGHNLFKHIIILSLYENQKNKACSLQHQLSFGVVPKVSQASIDWGSQRFSRENHQRSLLAEGLGAYQFVSSTGPFAHFSFCFSDFQPDVCSQGLERSNGSQGYKRASFCQEILESKLLCWNRRNSHRTNNPKIYSRTGNEVNVPQFPTATRLQRPLAT